MRREVEWFANRMERKLQVNDHKSGWQNDSFSVGFEKLKQELYELQEAIGRWHEVPEREMLQEVINEAADVANYAMMVADKAYRTLYEERTTPSGPQAGDGQAEAGPNQ